MISVDDFLWFVDEALDGMVGIVVELGDDLANRRPDLPGANSPYAILFHCLGVMEWWGGVAVAGRPVERDRDAEFRATGPVSRPRGAGPSPPAPGWPRTWRSSTRRPRPGSSSTSRPATGRSAPPRAAPPSTSTRSWPSTAARWR